MSHTVNILFQHRQWILAGKGKMACVIAQENTFRISICHHPVGFFRSLYHSTHMMMEAQLKSPIRSDTPQLIQAAAQQIPLPVVHYMLMTAGQNRRVQLSLYGVALLADIDTVTAHGSQEIQFLFKILPHLIKRLGQQKRGKPAAGNTHSPQIQGTFQLHRIRGILVADLTAGKTCQSHFADGLAECVLRSQVGHIIIAPTNGSNSKLYFCCIKHFDSSL